MILESPFNSLGGFIDVICPCLNDYVSPESIVFSLMVHIKLRDLPSNISDMFEFASESRYPWYETKAEACKIRV
jgi:hypothetical protein